MAFIISPTSITHTGQPPNTDLTYPISVSLTLTGVAYSAILNNVVLPPNSDFTLSNLPGFPLTMNSSTTSADTVAFNVNINKLPGTYTTVVTITTSQGTFSVPVSITISQATQYTITPSSYLFPGTVINTTSSPVDFVVTNVSGSTITISNVSFTNPDFSLANNPLPATLAPGASVTLSVQVLPTVSGLDQGTMTVSANIGGVQTAFVVTLAVVGLLFIEVNALDGQNYVFLMGFGPVSQVRQVIMPVNSDSELSQRFIFNGTLWDGVSSEKVIRRLQFYYENIGICTLTATAHVQRYRPDNTIFMDTQTSTVTFGTEEADGWEYSSFFDFQLAGEIIYVDITREADAGPCSVYMFVPFIEDKGEKVERK